MIRYRCPISIGVLLFWGTFVWPTPYSYYTLSHHWSYGPQGSWTVSKVYRVHRLTGVSTIVAETNSMSTMPQVGTELPEIGGNDAARSYQPERRSVSKTPATHRD